MTDAPSSVADVMTSAVVSIAEDASLAAAARLLDEHQIAGVPVVDAAGALVGVLSQADLVRARATQHLWQNWQGLAVRDLMTRPALTINASASLGDAARLMEEHRVHRLVVVADDGTSPIGIVSTSDLVRVLAGTGR